MTVAAPEKLIEFSEVDFVVVRSISTVCESCGAAVVRYEGISADGVALFEPELTKAGTYHVGYPAMTWKDERGREREREYRYKDDEIAVRRLRPEELEYARTHESRGYLFAMPHACAVAAGAAYHIQRGVADDK